MVTEGTMGITEVLGAKRAQILQTAARHGVTSVRVFGSVARGNARADSDVDLLVEMEPGRSLMDIGGLVMDLQDLLARRVDVVEPQGLHWYVRERILAEAVPL